MNTNFLPKELEAKYVKYGDDYFDFWNIQKGDNTTDFHLIGKFLFRVEMNLTPDEIIHHMNLYTLIYNKGLKDGVKLNQGKVKRALGLN